MKDATVACPLCGKSETLMVVMWGWFCIACRSSKGASLPKPEAPPA